MYPAYLKLFNENGLQFEMIVILLVGEHSALPENCGSVSKQKTEWAAALWGRASARMKSSTQLSVRLDNMPMLPQERTFLIYYLYMPKGPKSSKVVCGMYRLF